MATSRLFSLLGPSIIRNSHNFPQIPPHKFNKIFFPLSLRFRRYSSSALSLDSTDTDTLNSFDSTSAVSVHPWPEWVKFVDRLKEKGYIAEKAANLENEGAAVYTDMNMVKDACLNFARDRYDIFKSLSTQDIHRVVEKGCPNLFRKAVNSAKRLRSYLELDESDVCSSCNLRGSCDRAYVMLNESEAAARTIDIVRILLLYALDPIVISGEVKPPGRELVEGSARKLFSELIELGETAPDPELPKPAVVTSQRKKQSLDLSEFESSRDDQMKPGDWVCTTCNFMNFARNIQCRKCKADGPKNVSRDVAERKKGDWDCPQCSFMNFASKRQCFKCQEPRPKRELRPGDWECPNCDFLNFSRNTVCRKCNHENPQGSMMQSDTWKRPY
ncbi:hypothetical protein ACJIZ3_004514 [Penstemon smallii]|uniref:RanBP2-type domain-containing protein n=1 Tax=Penstemon smallii TaxID=265156 RepID=A0ABD3S2A2_9LAMI